MINFYRPDHFGMDELMPPEMVHKYPDEYLLKFFDPRLLWTGDQIRKRFGKLIANTWRWGGEHKYRGWRSFDCEVGAKFSQHKFGRALDLVPAEVSADEIRSDMFKNPDLKGYRFITCIETDISWFHFDVRNFDGLLRIAP